MTVKAEILSAHSGPLDKVQRAELDDMSSRLTLIRAAAAALGRCRSAKKSAACRINGKKGGRPKKAT
jgi:hypothetical protein